MVFFATSRFQQEYSKLVKKERDGYGSLPVDLFNFFNSFKTLDELWGYREMIYSLEDKRVLKSRVSNSGQNLPEKNGFRVVFAINKIEKVVALLFVYPKRGKYSAENLRQDAVKMLLKEYITEKTNKKLVSANINSTGIIFTQIKEVEVAIPADNKVE